MRPRVGIAACLLGEPVRYDGGHKRDAWLADVLGSLVEWVPVCPEVEAGFGVPRETMDLVRGRDGAVRLLTAGGRDVTAAMAAYVRQRVEQLAALGLSGYVLKAGSPSCGPERVPVRGGPPPDVDGRGLFADALLARLPDLPVEDERRLADPGLRDAFVARVFACHHDRLGRPSGATPAETLHHDRAPSG